MISHLILKFCVIQIDIRIKFFKLVSIVSHILSHIKIFFFLSITTSFLVVNGQTLISSQGDFINNGNGSNSYSVGEPIISTLTNTNGDVTQGFQQVVLSTNNILANFEVDEKFPCFTSNGATVNFTDLSTGSPTSWLWSFGDGNTSTLQNPSHTYTNAGTYNVSLSINNNQDTKTENNYIEINNTTNCIPDTYLDDDYCNISCNEFTHRLYAHYTGADEYRFTFKNLTNPNISDVIITRSNGARTMHFAYAGISDFGHTFEVSVECQFTNPNSPYFGLGWSKINKLCNVTTPNPTSKLTDDYCGPDESNAYQCLKFGTRMYAEPVGGASKYRFTFTNTDVVNFPNDVYVKENIIPTCHFNWMGISKIGATYKVNVQAKIGNNYTQTNDDFACYVSTPSPTTQISSTYWGTSSAPYDNFSAFNDRFWADYVNGASAYEFYFENDDDPNDNYTKINSARPSVHFSWMGISKLGATYKVQVRARIGTGNDWTQWGALCYVTTPSPTTQIENIYCGTSSAPYNDFEKFNDRFWAESIGGASAYEFYFENDSDPNDNYTKINSARPSVHFSWMGINSLGTTYKVTVKAKIGNNWTTNGNTCYLNTPNPTTQLMDGFCSTDPNNAFPSTSFSHRMYADEVPGASGGYEFTYVNQDPNNPTTTTKINPIWYSTHLNFMGLNNAPDDCEQTYAVTVKAVMGSQKTNAGQTCYVKSHSCMALNPNPKIRDANHVLEGTTIFNDLDVIVFPNPSNGSRITIKGSIDKLNSLIELSVLGINGKLIESKNYKVSSYMYEKSWDFKSSLNQGIYLLNIKVDDNIIIKKIIVQ